MSNNPYLSAFENSAYKFIDELKNLSIEVSLLPVSEARKTKLLVFLCKNYDEFS